MFNPTVFYSHGTPVMTDYMTGGSAVNAGDVVVVGDCPRIAHSDIPANTIGAVAAGFGVYKAPKASTGGSAIAGGVPVFWNAGAKQITTTSTGNTFFGWTVNTSLDADTTQIVLHLPGDGAVGAALTNPSLTDSTGGNASGSIAAITAPAANATTSLTADMTAVKNGLSTLVVQLNALTTTLRNAGVIQ